MTLEAPIISNDFFIGMTACVSMDSDSVRVREFFEGLPPKMNARHSVEINNKKFVCGYILHGSKKKYFHVDLVREDDYPSAKAKYESPPIATIDNFIQSILGEPVRGELFGRYRLPFDRLPSTGIIQAARFTISQATFSLSSIGGTLAVGGAPVRTISWRASRPDPKIVTVDMDDALRCDLDELYLCRNFDRLQRAFEIFILPEQERGD